MKISTVKLLKITACLLLAVGSVQAEEVVVMRSLNAVVTVADIESELQRMPAEARKNFMARSSSINQLASNILTRRQLALQAVQTGLGNDETTQAALNIARERVLSDLALQQLDKAQQPSDAALEKIAQSTYKVDVKRFVTPEQVQISHILLAPGPESKEKAEKLMASIRAGEDFASLAKTYSIDRTSANKGGDLGLQARGKWIPAFENAAFALTKPGEIAGPVETDFGFHIMKLVSRQPSTVRPYEEVRETLKKETEARLINDARKRETDRLLKDSQYNPESFDVLVSRQPK